MRRIPTGVGWFFSNLKGLVILLIPTLCLAFAPGLARLSLASEHLGKHQAPRGLFYSITHMHPVVYLILFLIFVLSVLNLYYQWALSEDVNSHYVRSNDTGAARPTPKGVVTGKVFTGDFDSKAGGGVSEGSDRGALRQAQSEKAPDGSRAESLEIPELSGRGAFRVPQMGVKESPPILKSLQARAYRRVRLDKARLPLTGRRFAAAYTDEPSLEHAETMAAYFSAMRGDLFQGPAESLQVGPTTKDNKIHSLNNNQLKGEGGLYMPPKKSPQTKKSTRRKPEATVPEPEVQPMETLEKEPETQVMAPSVAPNRDMSVRIARIDSLIEAAQHGELNGRVPEIRREHESRWGKLLDEDISLREQILTLKQKENTLLRMIRDQVADNVLETSEIAGKNGLVKTPKA